MIFLESYCLQSLLKVLMDFIGPKSPTGQTSGRNGDLFPSAFRPVLLHTLYWVHVVYPKTLEEYTLRGGRYSEKSTSLLNVL